MKASLSAQRRNFLKMSLTAGSMMLAGLISVDAKAQGKTAINMQIGWLVSGNQIGEVVAKRLGYYEHEGIDFGIVPGGPNIDGVAVIAAGKQDLGQVSSSPSVMLAVSQGLPIKCFAVGAQRHPFCFFSLAKNPVRKPADFIGRRIGMPSTSVVLLRALLARNKIAEKDVDIIPIGTDMSPLLTGQVDVVSGWLTNTTALKVLGKDRVDLTLWDAGVQLYGLPYYATLESLQTRPAAFASFLRATAKGWFYARDNRDQAVDLLVKEYPNLNYHDERAALDVMLAYSFDDATRTHGWGTMDPMVWTEQISMYQQLKQFSAKTPKLEDVMTLEILKATTAARTRV